MRNSTGFLVVIALAIAASYWFWRPGMAERSFEPAKRDAAVIAPPVPPSQTVPPALDVPVASPAEEKPVAKTELAPPSPKSVRQLAPKLDTLRDEVQRNPHETPLALMRFSIDVAEKMAVGVQSEDKARTLFGELEECALGGDQKGNPTVQAVCILNAKRLKTKYPALATRFDGIEKQSDPEAVRLANVAPL